MLTQAAVHIRQRRRAALAHQCRSCQRFWALRLIHGAGGQLIVCRFCGAPRGAQSDDEIHLTRAVLVPSRTGP